MLRSKAPRCRMQFAARNDAAQRTARDMQHDTWRSGAASNSTSHHIARLLLRRTPAARGRSSGARDGTTEAGRPRGRAPPYVADLRAVYEELRVQLGLELLGIVAAGAALPCLPTVPHLCVGEEGRIGDTTASDSKAQSESQR